ncbi:uncharacterized protein LOC126668778 [Mercurialis annua]|uniref:uncharacterized protein LOC126668778 n=1 Tax=Mercurialis annua TaxID=3986 RepID=UPI0021609846|nr:uncharacterized protein LOC126668778 [Mercurialis annua]
MFDTFNFISWNCRGGVSHFRKQRSIPSFVSLHNLSIVGLIETKRASFDDFLIRRLWPNLDFGYCFSSSTGASGGLACVWNTALVTPTRIITSNRWISLDFIWCNSSIRFIVVYAPNCPVTRSIFWEDLLPELTCDRLSLVEVPLHGRFFTWNNSFSRSKIDRCFISPSVFALWPNLHLKALPRSFSDHTPIRFTSAAAIDWGPRPFRSLNAWWKHEDFAIFVHNSWHSFSGMNNQHSLVNKLRNLRRVIKDWNKNVFGNMNAQAVTVQQQITNLEQVADVRILSDLEKSSLATLHSQLFDITRHLKLIWLQKSRLNWSLLGDKNTSFFHLAATVHAKNNQISEVVVDNICYTTPFDIKKNVSGFYQNLYKRTSPLQFSLSFLTFKKLTADDAANMITGFDLEEIHSALCNCDSNKAPGPDGFNLFFYKQAWEIIKTDLFNLFQEFHRSSHFPASLNTAFLILIPKIKGARDIKDFRPISLINGIFKILSKMLANRLGAVLHSLISENQFGFIKGRNIHDCHSIASELIHLTLKRKEQYFIIKLDFQKAFDSVSWSFILYVMEKNEF